MASACAVSWYGGSCPGTHSRVLGAPSGASSQGSGSRPAHPKGSTTTPLVEPLRAYRWRTTVKCRCGPVLQPLVPESPICWPTRTESPVCAA